MKKSFILLVLIISVIFAACCLAGCNPNSSQKEGITLPNGVKLDPSVTLSELVVTSYPAQYYRQNTAINLEGGKVKAVFSDGTTYDFNMTDEALTVRDQGTKVNQNLYEIKISYLDKTTSINYYVGFPNNANSDIYITKVDLISSPTEATKSPMQTVYSVGGSINYFDAYIKIYTNSTATITMPLSKSATNSSNPHKLSGFETETLGKRTMKIQYYASVFEIEYEVVQEVFLLDCILDTDEIDKVYFEGDTLALGKSRFLCLWSDSTEEYVSVTADMISGLDTSAVDTTGDKKMTLYYNGKGGEKDAVFNLEIPYSVYNKAAASGVSTTIVSDEVKFYVGESLKFSASVLNVTLSDGNTKTVRFDNPSVKIEAFTSAVRGQREMLVKYMLDDVNYLSAKVTYEVIAKVKSVEIIEQDTISVAQTGINFGSAQIGVKGTDDITDWYLIQTQFETATADRRVSVYLRYTVITSNGEQTKTVRLIADSVEKTDDAVYLKDLKAGEYTLCVSCLSVEKFTQKLVIV